MKIYVASSWRNHHQPRIVAMLKRWGHDVYDFRNPTKMNAGFHWSEIAGNWETWSAKEFQSALDHEIADRGFAFDKEALDWCDACVLVLPSGRSAHLEVGYAAGSGKKTVALLIGHNEPELMYKLLDAVVCDEAELLDAITVLEPVEPKP